MSVSPRQKRLKPPPVPEMPTVTWAPPPPEIWNSSATASVIGYTVLEPSISINSAACTVLAAPPSAARIPAARKVVLTDSETYFIACTPRKCAKRGESTVRLRPNAAPHR
jgi:hypothetical protein